MINNNVNLVVKATVNHPKCIANAPIQLKIHNKQRDKLKAELEMYVVVLPLPTGNPGLVLFSKTWKTTN